MTRRTVVLLVAAGATLALLVLVVFPTRSYLRERTNMNSAAHQLQTLNTQNRQLTDQIGRLNSDAILPGDLARNAAANKPPAAKPPASKPPAAKPPAAKPAAGTPPASQRGQAGAAHQSLLGRFLDQLAFWR